MVQIWSLKFIKTILDVIFMKYNIVIITNSTSFFIILSIPFTLRLIRRRIFYLLLMSYVFGLNNI